MPGPREIRLSQVRNRRKKSGLPAEELDASINSCTPRHELKGMNVRVQALSINQIKLNPRNPRTHSAKQIRQIANSIVAFGFTNPLLVTEDGTLIAGEGRYKAAQLLGLAKVPVIVLTGLSPARQRALAIADNKIAENAGWNRERLAIEIPELAGLLETEGLDVSILGFEAVEIDQLVTDFEENAADPQDSIDSKWWQDCVVSKRDDLWLLGPHRLLCGDARSAADIARLMAHCRADVAFLDPRTMCASAAWWVGAGRSTPSSPWRAARCRLPITCASSA
jgi:hypothetical protein